jgi:hypothetical protein
VQIRKNGQSPADRLLTVTHGELKDAVSRCQEWLLQNVAGIQLPSHGQDGKIKKSAPVALFMESDIGLWIYVVALMGLGVPVSGSGCLGRRIPVSYLKLPILTFWKGCASFCTIKSGCRPPSSQGDGGREHHFYAEAPKGCLRSSPSLRY